MDSNTREVLELKQENIKLEIKHLLEAFEQHQILHRQIADDKVDFEKRKFKIETVLKELQSTNKDLTDAVKKLLLKDGDFMIKITNGTVKDMYISDIVKEMYQYLHIFKRYSDEKLVEGLDSLMGIAQDWKVLKKFKVGWLILLLVILSLFTQLNLWEVLFKIL